MKRIAVTVLIILAIICVAIISCESVALPKGQVLPGKPAEITIMHINDTHAHLDDIAHRATLVKKTRDELGIDRVLMFDSGDVFMGTLYFNLMKGLADLEFMNMLGYDAMTLGNHEFDNYDRTPQYLNDFVTNAKFPIVCSNLSFSKTSTLKEETSQWLVIQKGGQQYGIFGLLTEDTAEISSPGKFITVDDHIYAARQAVAEFEKKGINKIIALTHIGWEKDIELAQKVNGIDIVIGGHSHTLPSVYPTIVKTKEPTLVVQAEAYGKYLGRLDLSFDEKGIITKQTGSLMTVADAPEDMEYATILAQDKAAVDNLKNTIVGKTLLDLDGERADIRTRETNFGNLVADAFLAKAGRVQFSIAIVNGGSIRSSIPAGNISLGQILGAIPYGTDLIAFEITGEQLIAALENGVSQVEAVAGRFPQVAGLRFTWDPASQPGSRIQSVEITMDDYFKPIDKSAYYHIVTSTYLYNSGDGYAVFQNGKNVEYLGFIDYDVVREFIEQHSPVSPKVEGRITSLK